VAHPRRREGETRAALFTKNGHEHSNRVRWMTDALARLRGVSSCIIDGELVACDGAGVPHFYGAALPLSPVCPLRVGLRPPAPQWARSSRSPSIPTQSANADWLRYSEPFDDGLKLLAEADRLGLEGIVSKRRDAPYRSGKQCDWIKI
jgi:bifunctional non-homologous end joining protein LigD